MTYELELKSQTQLAEEYALDKKSEHPWTDKLIGGAHDSEPAFWRCPKCYRMNRFANWDYALDSNESEAITGARCESCEIDAALIIRGYFIWHCESISVTIESEDE